jgi:hypothetical protein
MDYVKLNIIKPNCMIFIIVNAKLENIITSGDNFPLKNRSYIIQSL